MRMKPQTLPKEPNDKKSSMFLNKGIGFQVESKCTNMLVFVGNVTFCSKGNKHVSALAFNPKGKPPLFIIYSLKLKWQKENILQYMKKLKKSMMKGVREERGGVWIETEVNIQREQNVAAV